MTNLETKINTLENKLNNLEDEIINLFLKKYHFNYYHNNEFTYKLKKISIEDILNNFTSENIEILNIYINIENILCNYDIDILTIIFNYIKICKKLLAFEEQKKFHTTSNNSYYNYILSFIYNINDYEDENKNKIKRNDKQYFINKYKNKILRQNIKDKMILLGTNILVKYI
jgi:hypothetical protein